MRSTQRPTDQETATSEEKKAGNNAKGNDRGRNKASAHLEDDRSDLAPESRRRYLRDFSLLHRRNTGDEVHVLWFPDLRALPDLVPKVRGEEDRDVDVRNEEVGCTPLSREEHVETVNEDEDRAPEDTPPRKVRLKAAVIRTLGTIETLCTLAKI